MSEIEWKPVTKGGKLIGTIGFMDGSIVMVVHFYDARDANKDGKVSWLEAGAAKIGGFFGSALETMAIQDVLDGYAQSGYIDPFERAELIKQTKNNAIKVGSNLVMAALLKLYFSRIIGLLGQGLAAKLTTDAIKGFMIKKGFEKAVQEAMEYSIEEYS